MAHVSLDANGNVTGVYAQIQQFSTEISDDDPRVVAFLNPPAPAPTLTFLEFVALFTPAEQVAIASSTNSMVQLFVMKATGSGGLSLDKFDLPSSR